ncbi:hypothetical protein [Erythrobacter mangrovi]|uniref:DUF4386 family protein n=1 Tax=Erythrobacter mangrovi TaxID=2739433 RepID=A0A7D3XAE6_9SPHN|nr:hypothetical protein [Erythrobacter mangrovi]QKG71795.1 hypothetical protein HQR01_10730 [Erythrobacter mangrovi]
MTLKRAFLWSWIGGLVAFAIVIMLSLPLMLTEVPGGISDHQSAGTAAEIDRIQAAWDAAALYGQARIAMIGDLVFIGIYGVGCILGGRWFMQSPKQRVRLLGTTTLAAGAIFLVADYVETISQFVQLVQRAGDDGLAGLAATVRPIKMAAWLASFFVILAALLLDRNSSRTA